MQRQDPAPDSQPWTTRLPPALDILCRVIDNYGDAGVVLRLGRNILHVYAARGLPPPRIRLFMDRPDILAQLAPEGTSPVEVISMESPAASTGSPVPPAAAAWDGIPAPVIIQAFDAGLFEAYRAALEASGAQAPAGTVRHLLVNLEYLSAEDWTAEYHGLPSLSGMAGVKKFFFLPGFIPGTGGLLLGDAAPPSAPSRRSVSRSRILDCLAPGAVLPDPAGLYWLSLFSYEHDYTALVASLADKAHREADFRPLVLVAPGRSCAGFLKPWEAAGRPFPAVLLPFLAQKDYDHLIDACDFNIVRGEESLARAALAGSPFLWHAYLQDDAWQMVKVQALLDRMESSFASPGQAASWPSIRDAFLDFNRRHADTLDHPAIPDWTTLLQTAGSPAVRNAFQDFARRLGQLGDLAANLLGFMATNHP